VTVVIWVLGVARFIVWNVVLTGDATVNGDDVAVTVGNNGGFSLGVGVVEGSVWVETEMLGLCIVFSVVAAGGGFVWVATVEKWRTGGAAMQSSPCPFICHSLLSAAIPKAWPLSTPTFRTS
jgi:hypothetical protein